MADDQIQNHQGAWVKAEVAEALQTRVTELSAEVTRLEAQLAAAKAPRASLDQEAISASH